MNISASLTRDVHAAPPESTETQDRLDRIAYSVMFGTILESIRQNHDAKLRNPNHRGTDYPISTYLGECSRPAQAKLFAACFLAMNGDRAEEVAEALRAFVEVVADEYASDYAALRGEL